jgi:hypothetical protein
VGGCSDLPLAAPSDLLSASADAAAAEYVAIDLGTLGRSQSVAAAIGNYGT